MALREMLPHKYPYNRTGIYAALKSHGVEGRDVLVPAYNCVVVANSIICSGNRPVFVDIDPATDRGTTAVSTTPVADRIPNDRITRVGLRAHFLTPINWDPSGSSITLLVPRQA